MWQWHIVYEGVQNSEDRGLNPSTHAKTTKLFQEANAIGTCRLGDRIVAGMYVINRRSEQEDVILCYGRVSHEIRVRHAAYEASKEKAPPERG